VNLGNCGEMSVLDLARLIIELTGSSSPIVFVERPEDDPSVRRPDIRLAREALGWEPTVDVRDGLRRTIDWFRTQLPGLVPSSGPPAGRPVLTGSDRRAG
jgi:nucleoside-diphosphate-sugar epimerase